ncbi:MAG: hypothetical protein ACXAC2_21165, partial [Candidatus Kariarchaeaceae archaeon]
EDTSRMLANSTYSIVFEEFVTRETRIDMPTQFIGEGAPRAPETAPMDSLSIRTTIMDWMINGALHSAINTIIVSAAFSLVWEAQSTTSFPIGNTDPVDFTVNQTLIYQSDVDYYYDDDNGAFLGQNSSTTASYEAFEWNDSFQISFEGTVQPGLLASNQTIYVDFDSYNEMWVNFSTEGYGNSRLPSTGDNRLETGQSLFYRLETDGRYDSFFDLSITSSQGTNSRNEDSEVSSEGRGTMEMRIWRHDPGFVEAAIIMKQDVNRNESRDVTDSDPNWPGEHYADSFFDVFVDIDLFSSPSSAVHEVEAELDDMKSLDLGDDDRDDCRDCDDGGFNIPVPRDMLLTNQSTEIFIPEPDVPGEPVIVINDFDYIVEVEALRGDYGSHWEDLVEIRLGDGPEALFVNATVIVDGWARQGFYWDTTTGVLLAIEEESRADIFIDFNGQVFDSQSGEMVTVNIHGETHFESKFFMLLETHPNEYLEVQTDFPTTKTSTSASSSTTTSEPTTVSSSSSKDEDDAAGLPIPIPIVPVFLALGMIAIYVRNRKY